MNLTNPQRTSFPAPAGIGADSPTASLTSTLRGVGFPPVPRLSGSASHTRRLALVLLVAFIAACLFATFGFSAKANAADTSGQSTIAAINKLPAWHQTAYQGDPFQVPAAKYVVLLQCGAHHAKGWRLAVSRESPYPRTPKTSMLSAPNMYEIRNEVAEPIPDDFPDRTSYNAALEKYNAAKADPKNSFELVAFNASGAVVARTGCQLNGWFEGLSAGLTGTPDGSNTWAVLPGATKAIAPTPGVAVSVPAVIAEPPLTAEESKAFDAYFPKDDIWTWARDNQATLFLIAVGSALLMWLSSLFVDTRAEERREGVVGPQKNDEPTRKQRAKREGGMLTSVAFTTTFGMIAAVSSFLLIGPPVGWLIAIAANGAATFFVGTALASLTTTRQGSDFSLDICAAWKTIFSSRNTAAITLLPPVAAALAVSFRVKNGYALAPFVSTVIALVLIAHVQRRAGAGSEADRKDIRARLSAWSGVDIKAIDACIKWKQDGEFRFASRLALGNAAQMYERAPSFISSHRITEHGDHWFNFAPATNQFVEYRQNIADDVEFELS